MQTLQARPKVHDLIHPTAVVDPKARIAPDVEIGPYSIIGPDVSIDSGTSVGPHVVIKGNTDIGKNNRFFQFCSIGEIPQDKKYYGENAKLIIGDGNTIRENVTINIGTNEGGGKTIIGNENWIMANVHIAHDCVVGNYTQFANYAALAGHVVVKDYAIISGYSAIHQFCEVGQYSFVARATYVVKDVLPFILVAGYNAEACGLNSIGLKRHGFSREAIEALRRAYKVIFRKGLTVQQSLVELHEMLPEAEEIQYFIKALKNSERGIIR